MYAIIETGSKQYRVETGEVIEVERLPHEDGAVVFNRVLAVGTDDDLKVGQPALEGVTVKGRLLDEFKSKKVIVFKKKRRKQYRRTNGHRQQLMRVLIDAIEGV